MLALKVAFWSAVMTAAFCLALYGVYRAFVYFFEGE